MRYKGDGGGERIIRRVAPHPSGRCLRQRCLAALDANLSRSFSSFPVQLCLGNRRVYEQVRYLKRMVVGEGFEPSKSVTADLQSAPFGRSGTPPGVLRYIVVKMVVGEGLFVASLLTLRAVACGNVVSLSLDANLNLRFSPFPGKLSFQVT